MEEHKLRVFVNNVLIIFGPERDDTREKETVTL
jgi:hypothetical protein